MKIPFELYKENVTLASLPPHSLLQCLRSCLPRVPRNSLRRNGKQQLSFRTQESRRLQRVAESVDPLLGCRPKGTCTASSVASPKPHFGGISGVGEKRLFGPTGFPLPPNPQLSLQGFSPSGLPQPSLKAWRDPRFTEGINDPTSTLHALLPPHFPSAMGRCQVSLRERPGQTAYPALQSNEP